MTEGTTETPEVTPEGDTLIGTPAAEQATSTPDNAAEATPEAEAAEQGTEKTGAEQDSKADKSEEVGAPDEYEDFTVPEGVELNSEAVDAFKPIAKDLGLTQDQAQKLVDFQIEQNKAHAEQVASQYDEIMTEWQSQVKADKEIGGKALETSLADAKLALKEFGTPELAEALETTGMGNNLEFIRVFARMGKAMKEDGVRSGSANPGKPKDTAALLFPNQK